MEKRVSFIFYRSFYEAIALLEPEERLEVMTAICEYGLDGTEPALSGGAAAVFAIARANLDATNAGMKTERREDGRKKRRFCRRKPVTISIWPGGMAFDNLMKQKQ